VRSHVRDTISQLLARGNCAVPACAGGVGFLTNLRRQAFPPRAQPGAEVQVQLYDGTHSWPAEADHWIVDFFRGRR
jgi:hypothetical protein